MSNDFDVAHTRSIGHRNEILASDLCGCFYCLHIFPPSEIEVWCDSDRDDTGTTALCPKCGIDSVIGSKSGFTITYEFLSQMKSRWFG
jgi:hypothetical protein